MELDGQERTEICTSRISKAVSLKQVISVAIALLIGVMTSSKFLRHTMHRFLFTYLALDFVHACTRWYTLSKGGTLPDVHAEPFPVRAAVGWLAAFETYNALQWPYYLFATITTATGICRPEQWPNLMRCFREDMWSVRQFWGFVMITEYPSIITNTA